MTEFIGSPNVEAEKIVEIHGKTEKYVIPVHEFSKAAILGDYSHFVAATSLAMNLFDVQNPDRKEHFLCPLIVTFLLAETTEKDRDGFVRTNVIAEEMQRWGFLPLQTESALRRVTNKRLIETTERLTFEEDLTGLIGAMPEGFRATSIGAYHIRRWLGVFAYLDAMVFDTPIFDEDVAVQIASKLESYDISDRYERTLAFRNYLTAAWDASGLRPPYFDWLVIVKQGQENFDRVRRAIERITREQQEGKSRRLTPGGQRRSK